MSAMAVSPPAQRRPPCCATFAACSPGTRRLRIGPTTSLITCAFASVSIERLVRSPVADLLADLGTALEAAGVPWYLFGAQAAIVYGVARLTADVDVTVRAPAGLSLPRLADAIEARGFRRRFDAPGFIEASRVLPFVHEATELPVDVVLAGPGIEDEFLARATVQAIDGVPVPVADATDLVVMKALAGRAKDVDDLVALLRLQGRRIDLARARQLLQAFEEALGQSDLLPILEQAVRKAVGP
jgi:hypothetical protein